MWRSSEDTVSHDDRLPRQEDSSGARSQSQFRPVAIIGMHRSGTSMVARLLHEAGLNLGSQSDLMPPAEENPEGFYEHLEFVRLNDEVLNAAGAGWDCPPPADVNWDQAAFQPFRQRAEMLAEPLQLAAPWGWKDPRTTLTFPFWQSAFGPLLTIAVIRNPLEVVSSLHRRNGFSIALSLTLWRIYAERILAHTAPDQRLVTHFDAYFLEPEREIARVLAFIGLPSAHAPDSLPALAVPSLRHHRKTTRDLVEHGFPAEVVALYRALSAEAEWWEGDAQAADVAASWSPGSASSSDTISRGTGAVDLLRVENEVLRRNNAEFTDALAGREIRIAELETALHGHETARAELEGRLRERDRQLNERNALVARRDLALSAMQQQLATNAAELARLAEQSTDHEARLVESERLLAVADLREREQRKAMTSLQAVQFHRDAEIMGTLGAVLSRHAPGAPASIYHRRMVNQVRRFSLANTPVGSRVLVAVYGDPAMLQLDDRHTELFPRSASPVTADYTDVSEEEAIAQIDARCAEGAEFLVVPGTAMPWLASHPELERHLDERHEAIARERGTVTIYALRRQHFQVPA